MRKYTLAIGLGLLLVGLLFAAAACQPQQEAEFGSQAVRERASIYAKTDSWIVDGADILWYSDNRTTQTASVAGDTGLGTFTDVTVSDDLAVTDDATFGGLIVPTLTNLTATDGMTITPTSMVYALDSAGAVTVTLAASGTEGQLLILIGDDSNNVTVADTNLRSADGNAIVIAQYEVVMFVYQDAEWLVVANTDNS